MVLYQKTQWIFPITAIVGWVSWGITGGHDSSYWWWLVIMFCFNMFVTHINYKVRIWQISRGEYSREGSPTMQEVVRWWKKDSVDSIIIREANRTSKDVN